MASTQQLLLGEGAGGAEKNYIEDVFSTYLYTGNGSTTRDIDNDIDLSTKGGMVWLKHRNGADHHRLFDTTRGATKVLSSSLDSGEFTELQSLRAFFNDGFRVGSDSAVNQNGDTYASWTFRKQPKFFDVVTYTGNGTAGRTVAHSLGSTPGCIIVKQTNASARWVVYHRSLGATQYLQLDKTAVAQTYSGFWNDTSPTSTSFTVGNDSEINGSGQTYVAYIFAHDAGGFGLTGTDNVISCGSYTGNGSGTGPTITLGYEPQWVMIKNATTGGYNWYMADNMRGLPTGGPDSKVLYANLSNAEANGNEFVVSATGFGVNTTSATLNASGSTYIYIAIRRGPMKVPTDATKVFDTQYAYSSSPTYRNTILTDGFIQFAKESGYNKDFYSRLTGTNYLSTNSTAAESTNASLKMDIMNGVYTAVSTPPTYMAWLFKRAPSFFDEVCYTGNYTGGGAQYQTLTHNLQAVPELMIVKRRSSIKAWNVYFGSSSTYMELQSTAASTSAGGRWYSTSPTSTQFTVGNDSDTNLLSETYVAYLFATCPGVSKVGSFTQVLTVNNQVNCGFTAGARFVLIKRTDSTGDWYVWDSARGIVSGNDPYLRLNLTNVEVTASDCLIPYSQGFETNGNWLDPGQYIYLAIA